MKLPRSFYQPLAIGAPAPLRELPVKLERMIHFVPPHIEKVTAKVPELTRQVGDLYASFMDTARADQLRATPMDVMVVAAYGLILPQSALDIPILSKACLPTHDESSRLAVVRGTWGRRSNRWRRDVWSSASSASLK